MAWHGDGAKRCAELSGEGVRPAGSDPILTPLPFDHARAHKLYTALFGEVADLIKGKHLLLVPSGPLTQLPFQVLVTDRGSDPQGLTPMRPIRWLVRDHVAAGLKVDAAHCPLTPALTPPHGMGSASCSFSVLPVSLSTSTRRTR